MTRTRAEPQFQAIVRPCTLGVRHQAAGRPVIRLTMRLAPDGVVTPAGRLLEFFDTSTGLVVKCSRMFHSHTRGMGGGVESGEGLGVPNPISTTIHAVKRVKGPTAPGSHWPAAQASKALGVRVPLRLEAGVVRTTARSTTQAFFVLAKSAGRKLCLVTVNSWWQSAHEYMATCRPSWCATLDGLTFSPEQTGQESLRRRTIGYDDAAASGECRQRVRVDAIVMQGHVGARRHGPVRLTDGHGEVAKKLLA